MKPSGNLRLQSVRVRNFKAIVDSKTVKLGPLTVFIGNNGSGKSSLVEALETYQTIVVDGLDSAMQRWKGIEHARHKGAQARERAGKFLNPMAFELTVGASPRKVSRLLLEANNDPAANRMFISAERLTDHEGDFIERDKGSTRYIHGTGRSLLGSLVEDFERQAQHVRDWQFLTLQPEKMGEPVSQQRTEGGVRLEKNGANIADYLRYIRWLDQAAFEGILRTMAYVLPYARDLQPSITSELERKAYLQLTEADFKVPGWMLSTGTLRMLALLALLRHPIPPPLIVVEEIENGLDPRSIHVLVEEIRSAVLDGITQVVLTTHSPYLLDLLKLDQLVLVARDENGEPRFHRPDSDAKLNEWAAEFAPGRLYTMGKLHEAAQ